MKHRLPLFVLLCVGLIGLSVADAQEGRGRGRGRGFGQAFGGGGSLRLLFDEDVRKELEVVDEQYEKLRDLARQSMEESRDQFREMFQGLRDLSEEERREKFAEIRQKMEERTKALEEKVSKVLLPHQMDRLKQLELQSRMRRAGTAGALANNELAEKLGITEEQKERMRKAAEDAEKELQEKIAKAREEAREKILGVLTPDQQQKLKSLIGEQYEFQSRGRFGQGGPGRGGFRGRGGDRGAENDRE